MAAKIKSSRLPAPEEFVGRLMLCTLLDEPFDRKDWIFEPKLDGLRAVCWYDGETIDLISRNGNSQAAQFPEIVTALKSALPGPCVLDGEVVCLDKKGQSSFRALQQRFHVQDTDEIERRSKNFPAVFCVFDILYADNRDIRELPLEQRKEILHGALHWNKSIQEVPWTRQRGIAAFTKACAAHAEGIIAKKTGVPYSGGRGGSWIKLKCTGRQEFVIAGFTNPRNSRPGLGALLVGYYDRGLLKYAGKVGTGFTLDALIELRDELGKLEIKKCPFAEGDASSSPEIHWVKPQLVAEIAFAEWTQNGLLRQPRFEGIRPDKTAKQVRRESPEKPSGKGNEMSLNRYQKMRNFKKTAEPRGKVRTQKQSRKKEKKPIFVIHEHHATRLHYDLRLEAEGVLKSWAVTREPTLDPSVKRLAVEVEDHPIDYASFKGDIPEGEYGAGHVEIWDSGTFDSVSGDVTSALSNGKLKFKLNGKRLKGTFNLVRMRSSQSKPQWLLIKSREELKQREGTSIPEKAVPKPKRAAPKTARSTERTPALKKATAASEKPIAASRKSKATLSRTSEKPPSRATVLRRLKLSEATEESQAHQSPAQPPRFSPAVLIAGDRNTTKPREIHITHPEKLMFPDAELTKADIAEFHRAIAPYLLPHLQNRPITLERFPDGIQGTTFWQKNTPRYYPDWIPRVQAAGVEYPLVGDLETLLYMINQGALVFHVWLSRLENLDRPDFVLFDLDPDQASFSDVIKVAQSLHEVLEGEKLTSFIKTSGQSGLHVLVPWHKAGGYEEARAWTTSIAAKLISQVPELATLERSIAKREGRVYIDVMQNARGHHMVPPYTLRATPGATVSTPLEWKEVKPGLDPSSFTAKTILKRLRARGDLFEELLLPRIGSRRRTVRRSKSRKKAA